MTLETEKHPADEIGRSLSRAGGILSSISNCYNRDGTDFEVSLPFVYEAVATVEKLLDGASTSLTRLYEQYDLTKLPMIVAEDTVAEIPEQPMAEAATFIGSESADFDPTPQAEERRPYLGYFGAHEQVNRLADKLDGIIGTMPPPRERQMPDHLLEQPAQTYAEFLEKLTAMADAAAPRPTRSPVHDGTVTPVSKPARVRTCSSSAARWSGDSACWQTNC